MNQGNLGFSGERYFRGFASGFFFKAKRYSRIVFFVSIHASKKGMIERGILVRFRAREFCKKRCNLGV
jgi:hypothetical protein